MVKEGKSLEKEQAKSKELMEQPIKNILVVEDNEENLKTAQRFFTEGIKLNVDYAQDYKTAEKLLKEKEYDGILSDLFFPNDIENLDDTEKGLEALNKIWGGLGGDIETTPGEYEDARSFTGADKQLEKIERLLKGESEEEKGLDETFAKKDQPLGVFVVEAAKEKNIPYVVVTSGHAAHGDLASPVVAYLASKGLVKYTRGNNRGFEPQIRDFGYEKGMEEDEENRVYLEYLQKSSEEKKWQIPNKEEYIKKYIEKSRQYEQEKGRLDELDEDKEREYAEKSYERNILYQLNPLISDTSKQYLTTWHTAFRKLSDIAREQQKEE